ncbi:hypothetical protein BDZ89DRAFT_465337 [Hymenopellis radicata]|nr:hypothetical protein BDZ89DRAFT_465337 [Hymenopellis radicata]
MVYGRDGWSGTSVRSTMLELLLMSYIGITIAGLASLLLRRGFVISRIETPCFTKDRREQRPLPLCSRDVRVSLLISITCLPSKSSCSSLPTSKATRV